MLVMMPSIHVIYSVNKIVCAKLDVHVVLRCHGNKIQMKGRAGRLLAGGAPGERTVRAPISDISVCMIRCIIKYLCRSHLHALCVDRGVLNRAAVTHVLE
jgi:hypothetical protein